MTSSFDKAFASVFPALMAWAIQEIVRGEDAASFLAWMRDKAPAAFPELFASAGDEDAQRILALAIGRALWNVVPLPSHGYRPQPLPKPERNRPCPCGSGKKYKRCCAGAPSFPAIDPEVAWYHLAEQLSFADLEKMGGSRALPAETLGLVGQRLLKVAQPERAVTLLEAAFENPEELDGRYSAALDLLLDAYDETGDLEGKLDMLQYLALRLRPPLSAVLWRYLCFAAIEDASTESARELFQNAQRDDPEDPSLALLEVTILGAEGRFEQMSQRARFYLAWLRRRDFEDVESLVHFLRHAVKDPLGALLENPTSSYEHVGRLRSLLERIAEHEVPTYGLELEEADEEKMPFLAYTPGDGPLVRLQTPETLHQLEGSWKKVWPLPDGDDAWAGGELDEEAYTVIWNEESAEAWLGFLEEHPAAFDSLAILVDLILAAQQLGIARPVLYRHLALPLADRAETIVEASVKAQDEGRLLWYFEENQEGLVLLDRKIDMLDALHEDESARRLRERFLVLAPDDRFNHRGPLVNALLEAEEHERALAVAERYPGDLDVGVRYGGILALYRLGRKEEALALVAEVYEAFPLVADYLVGRRSDVPEGLGGVASELGGEEQAWWYNDEMGEVWQGSGDVLEWLEGVTEEGR